MDEILNYRPQKRGLLGGTAELPPELVEIPQGLRAGAVPQAARPVVPQAVVPQAVVPQAVVPQAVVPQPQQVAPPQPQQVAPPAQNRKQRSMIDGGPVGFPEVEGVPQYGNTGSVRWQT